MNLSAVAASVARILNIPTAKAKDALLDSVDAGVLNDRAAAPRKQGEWDAINSGLQDGGAPVASERGANGNDAARQCSEFSELGPEGPTQAGYTALARRLDAIETAFAKSHASLETKVDRVADLLSGVSKASLRPAPSLALGKSEPTPELAKATIPSLMKSLDRLRDEGIIGMAHSVHGRKLVSLLAQSRAGDEDARRHLDYSLSECLSSHVHDMIKAAM